jgi:predicted 2-oxoglutarate/Fe(II)-dependent dioxygenase YbiX
VQLLVVFRLRDRDLSLLIYLNDDFTGGGLTFTHFNFHFRPEPGDLLVFPSDNRYVHQAEKVESGVRYVIVSWAALKGVPRVAGQPPENAVIP